MLEKLVEVFKRKKVVVLLVLLVGSVVTALTGIDICIEGTEVCESIALTIFSLIN